MEACGSKKAMELPGEGGIGHWGRGRSDKKGGGWWEGEKGEYGLD